MQGWRASATGSVDVLIQAMYSNVEAEGLTPVQGADKLLWRYPPVCRVGLRLSAMQLLTLQHFPPVMFFPASPTALE